MYILFAIFQIRTDTGTRKRSDLSCFSLLDHYSLFGLKESMIESESRVLNIGKRKSPTYSDKSTP